MYVGFSSGGRAAYKNSIRTKIRRFEGVQPTLFLSISSKQSTQRQKHDELILFATEWIQMRLCIDIHKTNVRLKIGIQSHSQKPFIGFCVTLKNRNEKKCSFALIIDYNDECYFGCERTALCRTQEGKNCAVLFEANVHEKMECLPFCDKIHLVTDEIKSLAFQSIFVRLPVMRVFVYLTVNVCCRPAC